MESADKVVHREHQLTSTIATLLDMAKEYDAMDELGATVNLAAELRATLSRAEAIHLVAAMIVRQKREGNLL